MYRRILVPFDGSEVSTRALVSALRLARLSGAALRLLHIVGELNAQVAFAPAEACVEHVLPALRAAGRHVLDEGCARAAAAGVSADAVLVEDMTARVADLVTEQARAWKADLIVIGTHGRRGVDRFLAGSAAEQVLRHADVPVLLVRSPQEEASDGGLQSIAAAIA